MKAEISDRKIISPTKIIIRPWDSSLEKRLRPQHKIFKTKGISLKEASQEHFGIDLKWRNWRTPINALSSGLVLETTVKITLNQFGKFCYKTECCLGQAVATPPEGRAIRAVGLFLTPEHSWDRCIFWTPKARHMNGKWLLNDFLIYIYFLKKIS